MEIYEKVKLDGNLPLKFDVIETKGESVDIINKHWHRSIELIVPIDGNVFIWLSGKTFEVKAGEIFIINSRDIHSVYKNDNEYYKGYMIQVSYNYLIKCFEDIDSIYFDQIEKSEVKKEVLELIEKININYKSNDEHKSLVIEGNLLLIIHTLLCNQKKVRHDGQLIQSDKNRKRMLNITEYIQRRYRENITVEMVAEEFNLSYGHFVRLFKKNLNITVKEYITRIRLTKAREQIVNTDYAIVQIALENGFPNIQSFYKEFNKVYGTTPAKFRKISQINK